MNGQKDVHRYTRKHTHTHIYVYNTTQPQKNNEIIPCKATWVDIILGEVSQTEKDRQNMKLLICGLEKKLL